MTLALRSPHAQLALLCRAWRSPIDAVLDEEKENRYETKRFSRNIKRRRAGMRAASTYISPGLGRHAEPPHPSQTCWFPTVSYWRTKCRGKRKVLWDCIRNTTTKHRAQTARSFAFIIRWKTPRVLLMPTESPKSSSEQGRRLHTATSAHSLTYQTR